MSDHESTTIPEVQAGANFKNNHTANRWQSDFPDGGVKAWRNAFGCAGLLFCSFGYVNAFGVYQEYYQTHQLASKTPDDISWIGSLQVFFLFNGTLFGGPLFDRFGAVTIYPPAVVLVFSVMMTSLCKYYYQFILAQGVLGGIATGMIMAPGLAAVSQYFMKKRGQALGIAVAGSSLGGVIFPMALTKMLSHEMLGFGWAVRICGFVMLAVLMPSTMCIRARLPPRKKSLFLLHAFKERFFVALLLANFFMVLGVFIPIFYLPSYAVYHGFDTELARYLTAILNAASLFGRIIPGILADKFFGKLNSLCFAALCSGIICFCWPTATSTPGIIVFAAVYGFVSGAIVSMQSACFAQVSKDPRNIGTYLGMGMFCVSFGALVGTPISGALVTSQHGEYKMVSVFSGAVSIVGGLLALGAKMASGEGIWSKY